MTEQETKDNITQLWQRLIALENQIAQKEKTPTADILAPLTKRVEELERARTVQRQLNSEDDRRIKQLLQEDTKKPWWKL